MTDTSNSDLLAEAIESFSKSLNKYIAHADESKKREKKSNRLTSCGIAMITLLGVLIGVSATMYQFSVENALKRKFQQQQDMQIQIRQQMDFLDAQIRDKISKRDNMNMAMTKARNIIEVGMLYCKNGNFSGNELKYREKINYNLMPMVNAVYSAKQVFDQSIYVQARYFSSLLNESKNACDKSKNVDTKLRLLQASINESMNSSITSDQQKKEKLLGELSSSLSWKE